MQTKRKMQPQSDSHYFCSVSSLPRLNMLMFTCERNDNERRRQQRAVTAMIDILAGLSNIFYAANFFSRFDLFFMHAKLIDFRWFLDHITKYCIHLSCIYKHETYAHCTLSRYFIILVMIAVFWNFILWLAKRMSIKCWRPRIIFNAMNYWRLYFGLVTFSAYT